MKKVTFIHCADLHLDSPMKGLKYLPDEIFRRLQESTFKALTNIINLAIANEVDFVLIAGDIFDLENRSLRVQARFRKEMERLNEKKIPAYIIHGNHDHLAGKWTKMKWPENVHVFTDTVEVKPYKKHDGTTVHLYGFSYPKRHVTERWIDKYEKQSGADFHIGLLHGHFEGASDHGKYAPFRLSDLLEKQFDYWALGHIHKRSILAEEPPVIYPGNPQGRNRKETGAKGCYLVTMTESGVETQFQETNDVLWEEVVLDGSSLSNTSGLYELCTQALDDARIEEKAVVLSLKIDNLSIVKNELNSGIIHELLETLQDQEKEEKDFVWIRSLEWPAASTIDRSQLLSQGDFYTELFSAIDQFDHWDEAVNPLYRHNAARKHLTELNEEEKDQLLKEAETKLVQLLYQD